MTHEAMAPMSMPTLGTLFGVRLARFIPGTTQMAIFGAVMLAAAVFMLRGRPRCDETRGEEVASPVMSAVRVVPAGLLVGTLTGIVGVGGGFLIVPALVLLRMPLREAVGTSLLVITGACVVGFLGYLGHVRLDWAAVALVAAGMLPGIAMGSFTGVRDGHPDAASQSNVLARVQRHRPGQQIPLDRRPARQRPRR